MQDLDAGFTARTDTAAATIAGQIAKLRADVLPRIAAHGRNFDALRMHSVIVAITAAGLLLAAIAALRLA